VYLIGQTTQGPRFRDPKPQQRQRSLDLTAAPYRFGYGRRRRLGLPGPVAPQGIEAAENIEQAGQAREQLAIGRYRRFSQGADRWAYRPCLIRVDACDRSAWER